MKKHTFLGVNKFNRCCILYCLLPFGNLVPDELVKSDFSHDCTNWCGCDDVEKTLQHLKMTPTGNKIHLKKPITFYGTDRDMGHEYPWRFQFEEIWELKNL